MTDEEKKDGGSEIEKKESEQQKAEAADFEEARIEKKHAEAYSEENTEAEAAEELQADGTESNEPNEPTDPTETSDTAEGESGQSGDGESAESDGTTENSDTTERDAEQRGDGETADEDGSEQSEESASGENKEPENQNEESHVLKAEELKKVFGKKTAVNSVYFEVHSGEIVGLLGPNGAGKTTSFYMVVGFHKPTAGRIMLDRENITSLPMYKRARLGISYLPQEASIFKKLTVEENIWAILETRNDLSRAEKREMLENLIDEFHIGHIRKQQGFTLSGGERRRTEIARSLAIEPKFLLLDEPFAGIDPIAVADIKGIIKHLSERNIGILITDHNVRDTLEITERAYIVNKGEVLVSGSQAEIIENPEARQIYLGENFHM